MGEAPSILCSSGMMGSKPTQRGRHNSTCSLLTSDVKAASIWLQEHLLAHGSTSARGKHTMLDADLLVLGGERLVGQVELDGALLVAGELHEDVRVVRLALADGRVQADDDERVRRVALGQHEEAHDAVVLDAVVLRLQGTRMGTS